ncbi:helix-turn-helix domain-containing protein, partial [Actinomadura logoneensis]|uniref:helix-turn-helix domain-containing protein n=1 Tax=Actinomadura logoneensis TaxID=2293572 RepID=UPI0011C1A28F
VLAARRAGVSVRRTAELAGLSPDTVQRWLAEARAAGRRRVLQLADQSADPFRRGWALADRAALAADPADAPQHSDGKSAVALLHVAYASALARDPGLAPDEDLLAAAREAAVAATEALPVTATVPQVAAAADFGRIDAAFARLDAAAAALLAGDLAALAPHLRRVRGGDPARWRHAARALLSVPRTTVPRPLPEPDAPEARHG